MARRLVTDAKIVLERAGYGIFSEGKSQMYVHRPAREGKWLKIKNGTVDNDEIVWLMRAVGFNEFGHKR